MRHDFGLYLIPVKYLYHTSVVKLPLQMSYYYINSVSRLKFAGKWNIYSSIKKSVSIFFISYIFVDETPMLWSIINFTNLVPSINYFQVQLQVQK